MKLARRHLVSVIVSFAIVISAASVFSVRTTSADDEAKSRPSKAGSSSEAMGVTQSDDGELKFEGVEFKPAPFIVDEFIDIVRYQKLRENMSGGLTSDGVNFSITW